MGHRFQSPAGPERTLSSTVSDSNPLRRAVTGWLPPLATVALPGSTSIAYGLAARTFQGAKRKGAAWRMKAGLRMVTAMPSAAAAATSPEARRSPCRSTWRP
jgi:hypothetical protein